MSTYPTAPGQPDRRITLNDLTLMSLRGERWSMITAYDYISAGIFEEAGAHALLVGDSAAMVVYGYDSTLPVSVDELLPLVRAVVRGSRKPIVIADLPFGSYQASISQAMETSVAFMKDGGAQAVKLEGGTPILPQVEALSSAGIPVIGHLGLTPQSVHSLGGYRVQGRGEAGEILIRDAKALASAGAKAIVLEAIPADLAARVTDMLDIPTVGIGAGSATNAQVIVWQDLLGIGANKPPKFVRQYAQLRDPMRSAVESWIADVASGAFPGPENTYQ
jgi:3-methyl-2-oxobutanoate hydroxymethyltransferase